MKVGDINEAVARAREFLRRAEEILAAVKVSAATTDEAPRMLRGEFERASLDLSSGLSRMRNRGRRRS